MTGPHRPPREDGLTIYQAEGGYLVRVQAGALRLTIEGCLDEDEAVAVASTALEALAKGRGKLPARVADRTPRRLREALERG